MSELSITNSPANVTIRFPWRTLRVDSPRQSRPPQKSIDFSVAKLKNQPIPTDLPVREHNTERTRNRPTRAERSVRWRRRSSFPIRRFAKSARRVGRRCRRDFWSNERRGELGRRRDVVAAPVARETVGELEI